MVQLRMPWPAAPASTPVSDWQHLHPAAATNGNVPKYVWEVVGLHAGAINTRRTCWMRACRALAAEQAALSRHVAEQWRAQAPSQDGLDTLA